MKISIPTLCGLVAVSVLIPPTQAADQPKPGAEHKHLEMFVGDWTYEGSNASTPDSPAVHYHGTRTNRMVLGGFFLKMQARDRSDDGDVSQAVGFVGFDPATKSYVGHVFEGNGTVQTPTTLTVEGNTWTRTATHTEEGGKTLTLEGTITFSSDGMSANASARYSEDDGKTWLPLWKETWKRTTKPLNQ